MKFKFSILSILAIALPMLAQSPNPRQPDSPFPGLSVWSGSATNPTSTLSWVIVPATSANNGTPLVTYLNASSDLAYAGITNYYCTGSALAYYATNSTTTLSVLSTNGFASGDYIVIRHMLANNYEKRVLTTMTTATNLVLTVAPMETTVPGDVIYRYQGVGGAFIPLGAVTNIAITSTSGILAGQKGIPMLLEIKGTASCSLSASTIKFIP